MQHPVRPNPHTRPRAAAGLLAAGLLTAGLLALGGCDEVRPAGTAPRSFDGRKLTLSCPDEKFADAITPMVRAWAARTGAEVVVRRGAMTPADDSDLGVIPAGHLGEWGEAGLLVPVPAKLRASDNPFQWFGLLPAYGERLVEWGGPTLAVPTEKDGALTSE